MEAFPTILTKTKEYTYMEIERRLGRIQKNKNITGVVMIGGGGEGPPGRTILTTSANGCSEKARSHDSHCHLLPAS